MYAFLYSIILIAILIIGLTPIILHKEVYKAEKKFLYSILINLIFYFSYFFIFSISTFYVTTESYALILWNMSIIFNIFSITLWTSIYVLELHKSSHIKYLPVIFFILFSGEVIGLLLDPNSFSIYRINQDYIYTFNNHVLLTSIIILNITIICVLLISQIRGFLNYSDQILGKFYNIYISFLIINIITYLAYLISHNVLLKHLHLILYIANSMYLFYIITSKPSLFVVFTNKIYNFIIFHKSGILLYSYDFETNQELEESLLKGSILIGINHILSSFSNIEEQISIIKLRQHGILFHFNNELGYATLLIAKHKNVLLEKTLKRFNHKFAEKHRETLMNLDGLIDVSKFQNTTELIKEEFKPYLHS